VLSFLRAPLASFPELADPAVIEQAQLNLLAFLVRAVNPKQTIPTFNLEIQFLVEDGADNSLSGCRIVAQPTR
jgi:hypothetical protein